MKKTHQIILLILILPFLSSSQNIFQIAVLQYNGGGDWYANPTSLPNLVKFCNKNINTNIKEEIAIVEVGDENIFNYPFIHMTGHGNVLFSNKESKNLIDYLNQGGFLHIDDNYGMDPFIRKEIKRIFPNNKLIEIPINHPIFNQTYKFKNGLPKIHEHNQEKAQAFGIFLEGNLALLYTYESDLGDGWENQEIHNNSEETRQRALKMGANIIEFVFNQR